MNSQDPNNSDIAIGSVNRDANRANGSGAVLVMQTGLFHFGRERALQSGTTVSKEEDLQPLENHARATARDTYREQFDPTKNRHDAMHQAEYERALKQRGDAERCVLQGSANLRESERALADAPKTGPKPIYPLWLPLCFVVVISLTVAPTLHDQVFHSVEDEVLRWTFSVLLGGFFGGMLTWAILSGRSWNWSWLGCIGGVVLGVGLLGLRLSSMESHDEITFGVGLTIIEIGAVVLLEFLARSLRASEIEWEARKIVEEKLTAKRDADQLDLHRWKAVVSEKHNEVLEKIAMVEDRHNRHIGIAELEELAVRAVRDGYAHGAAENLGRLSGVRIHPSASSLNLAKAGVTVPAASIDSSRPKNSASER